MHFSCITFKLLYTVVRVPKSTFYGFTYTLTKQNQLKYVSLLVEESAFNEVILGQAESNL